MHLGSISRNCLLEVNKLRRWRGRFTGIAEKRWGNISNVQGEAELEKISTLGFLLIRAENNICCGVGCQIYCGQGADC